MKKVTISLLLVVVLLGSTGCRLPIIDPPIVGRWKAVDGSTLPGTSLFYEFSRDKTGKMEIIGSKDGLAVNALLQSDLTDDKQGGITASFTWSYKRFDRILTIRNNLSTTELKVDYNFFRTKATIYDIKTPNYRTDFELVSTLIFRL